MPNSRSKTGVRHKRSLLESLSRRFFAKTEQNAARWRVRWERLRWVLVGTGGSVAAGGHNGMCTKMIEIKLLNQEETLGELTSLVHRAYRQLANLGFKYWATHQTIADTKKRISKGKCYVGISDHKIVATVIQNDPDKIGGHPWYENANVTSFSQFAVDPECQKQGIGSKMMAFIEQKAIEMGVDEIACDTAEGAIHLIRMYRKRGYRIVGKANWDITNYTSVILSKKLS